MLEGVSKDARVSEDGVAHSNAKANEGASVDGRSLLVLNCRVGVPSATLDLILLFERDDRGLPHGQASRRGTSLIGR